MDHLRPDLEIDTHIGGAGALREADRVIEQRLRSADLDQQRRKPGEICVSGAANGERGSAPPR